MKIITLIGVLAITLNFTAYGQTSNNTRSTDNQDNWELLTENNYSIKHPSYWELNKSGQLGTSFILFSPASSEEDQFKENVNLLIQDLTDLHFNLDEYVQLSLNQIKEIATDAKSIESEKVPSGNSNYQKVIYTANQGDFLLKFEQYYWVQNNKAYVLTLTCEKDQFDAFKMTGEKILNSFKIQ
tara:strand:- start:6179 stop:6730 length:552 start_codon:yes stop_codon:yes gene_type:complete